MLPPLALGTRNLDTLSPYSLSLAERETLKRMPSILLDEVGRVHEQVKVDNLVNHDCHDEFTDLLKK